VEAHQALVLQSRDPLGEEAAEAEWLYRTLVVPAEHSIPSGSRVLVVPDGPLHQVNLETLVVPTSPRRYWIEDVTLASAPSLSLVEVSPAERPPGRAPSILLIGAALSPNEEFPPLLHAAREVDRIAAQFAPGQRAVYSGARAEPSAYRTAEPGRFSLIHFAAHAKANPLIPLDSAVILSAKGDAYKLYAREIVEIPLKAELVTLSACRSAGSRAT
jgi:CHAT domain-containing protein